MGKYFFMLFAACVAVYVPASLFVFSRYATPIKISGFVLLLLIAFKWLIYMFFDHGTGINYTLMLVFESLFNAFLCCFIFLFLTDLTHLALHHLHPVSWNWQKIKWFFCAISLLIGIYGTLEANKIPDVKEIVIEIPNLPKSLNGFSVIQLSDLHLQKNMGNEWIKSIVEKANSENPDLIVITGDTGDGNPDEIAALEELSKLKAKYGTYAISGNHETYSGYEQWISAIENLGIKTLENRKENITDALDLYGVADPMPIFDKKDKDKIRIGLAHRPNVAKTLAEHADFVMAGHTHGGQIFFMKPFVAKSNIGMSKGLYDNIFVSSGTGLWRGFMFRLGIDPEINLFILKNKE